MSTDPIIGGPSSGDRNLVYARMGLTTPEVSQIEKMVQESGSRSVGRGALTNVRVRFNSVKNGHARVLESHTCELIHAYELEFDRDVLGYYVQAQCPRVIRTTRDGRKHVSTAHLDFLVFRKSSVELVECKQLGWLEAECAKPNSRWCNVGSHWSYEPYAHWAKQRGLDFSVWVGPEHPAIYLQNLSACYDVINDQLSEGESRLVRITQALIERKPQTISDLSKMVAGFGERIALWMLANAKAFGPWRSVSLGRPDDFRLYAVEQHAKQVDLALLQERGREMSQPHVLDPILRASSTDLAKARERLARLSKIESGEILPTRRMRQLAIEVSKEIARGGSALSACLTKYSRSGNRTSRLLPQQEEAVEVTISKYWNTGKARRPKELLFLLEEECARLQVEPCGRARLDARRRHESPLRHALATGGFRAYHAIRPSTDPRSRSLAPLGYGQVMHVDSSDLDVRFAPDLLRMLPSQKAKFYIGIDGATGDTLAHALIFGSARTDGLALLMRECVQRNGFLPKMIHLDRGPENTSQWIDEFCEGRISLRHSPTAASAWNGIAENAIKQVNDQVAHVSPGSTELDQMGRRVDGRFKSKRQAKIAFAEILCRFESFIYDDLPATPRADGRTPVEARQESLESYGVLGDLCEMDDEFFIRTSIRVATKLRVDQRRGVRTADGCYVSSELQAALRTGHVEELRRDCCRPDVLYVRIDGVWLKAFHSHIQSRAALGDRERLFELLWAPLSRSASRLTKEGISRARRDRMKIAEAAYPATLHLAPALMAEEERPIEDEDLCAVNLREISIYDETDDF